MGEIQQDNHISLGTSEMSKGNFAEAERYFNISLENCRNELALSGLGFLQLTMLFNNPDQYDIDEVIDKAFDFFEEAKKLNPSISISLENNIIDSSTFYITNSYATIKDKYNQNQVKAGIFKRILQTSMKLEMHTNTESLGRDNPVEYQMVADNCIEPS